MGPYPSSQLCQPIATTFNAMVVAIERNGLGTRLPILSGSVR